jgi:chromosome segregation ATPase
MTLIICVLLALLAITLIGWYRSHRQSNRSIHLAKVAYIKKSAEVRKLEKSYNDLMRRHKLMLMDFAELKLKSSRLARTLRQRSDALARVVTQREKLSTTVDNMTASIVTYEKQLQQAEQVIAEQALTNLKPLTDESAVPLTLVSDVVTDAPDWTPADDLPIAYQLVEASNRD